MAFATLARTRAAARAWLQSARPLDVDPPAGVPAYTIESPAPIVALVGVFAPKLIAARTVIESCTIEELTAIVAHERGHLQARDNLKRWLMACAPDALRWTPIHQEIAAAWHDAAEDAADDVATRGDERARANLAALLVKIARLTPGAAWPAATVSPFVENDGLDRRVRRLLDAGRTPLGRRVTLVATRRSSCSAHASLHRVARRRSTRIYLVVEAVIALGRSTRSTAAGSSTTRVRIFDWMRTTLGVLSVLCCRRLAGLRVQGPRRRSAGKAGGQATMSRSSAAPARPSPTATDASSGSPIRRRRSRSWSSTPAARYFEAGDHRATQSGDRAGRDRRAAGERIGHGVGLGAEHRDHAGAPARPASAAATSRCGSRPT